MEKILYSTRSDQHCTCIFSNADTYTKTKRTELKILIGTHKPAIIGIVEVKPKNARFELQECGLKLEGYEMFHNLKKDTVGRGICLYILSDLKPSAHHVAEAHLQAHEWQEQELLENLSIDDM